MGSGLDIERLNSMVRREGASQRHMMVHAGGGGL